MKAPLGYSSQLGAPEKAVADHIKLAFTNPKATKPLNALKVVPGDSAAQPLSRLYLDKKRAARNRSAAIRECKRYWAKKLSCRRQAVRRIPLRLRRIRP